jgi:hypothetical protein
MLDWLTAKPKTDSPEVDWFYTTHEDGSMVRHLASGPTEIYRGGQWVKCDGCSFGQHPNGARRVGAMTIEAGEKPTWKDSSWS